MMRYLAVYLILLLNLLLPIVGNAQPLHFALLLGQNKQDAFWGLVHDFAQQAAEDLGVKLSVLYTNDLKRNTLKLISQSKALNVDAIIFGNYDQLALHQIKEAEQYQIPILLFNSDITPANKQRAGKPRQYFKYWLASLQPDDLQAGYLLAKHLIGQAKQKNLYDENGVVQIIAVNGAINDGAAQLRIAGLQKALKETDNCNLQRYVEADWSQDMARYKTMRLSQRYPDAKVYWTASDLMAIGVSQALTEQGLIQGEDYLTGGVDWSREGIAAVKEGLISTSAGGHFMDAAWAIIMLYDYFNGFPFDPGSAYQFQSPMALISKQDIDTLQLHNWGKIDFRLRSKTFNRQIKEYDFSPASVLKELHRAQN